MNTKEEILKYNNEKLEGTFWKKRYELNCYQIVFVEKISLYILVNEESGIAELDYCFDDFEDLLEELVSNNWRQY